MLNLDKENLNTEVTYEEVIPVKTAIEALLPDDVLSPSAGGYDTAAVKFRHPDVAGAVVRIGRGNKDGLSVEYDLAVDYPESDSGMKESESLSIEGLWESLDGGAGFIYTKRQPEVAPSVKISRGEQMTFGAELNLYQSLGRQAVEDAVHGDVLDQDKIQEFLDLLATLKDSPDLRIQ